MLKPHVELRPVDSTNWESCLKLKVTTEQNHFVTPVATSLVQTAYDSEVGEYLHPFAIYDVTRAITVGFLLYEDGQSPDIRGKGIYYIWSFLVSSEQQGKGYGRAALRVLLEHLQTFPNCSRVGVTFDANNAVAEKLYLSFGFGKVATRSALPGETSANDQITAILKFS